MTARVQANRTATPSTPPANNSLQVGELYLEMATPLRLWAGVPTTIVASGVKLLVDATAQGAANAAAVQKAGDTMTGPLVLSGAPTAPAQAANKAYVDTFLPLGGGTLTGALSLAADPTTNLQAATKHYVDNAAPVGGPYLALAGGTLTGPLVLAADPTVPLGAATKAYVDNTTVSLSGDAMTGSLGVGVSLPTAPAPFVPTLFTQSESSGEFLINSYQSAASAWVYKAAGFAARIGLDTNGALTLAAMPTGAAGAALVWTQNRLRIDPLGNAMLGGLTLPSDSDRVAYVAGTMILPIPPVGSAAIAFNNYHTAAGWKYLAAGYAGYYAYVNTNGQHIWISYASGAAGAAMGASAQMTFDATGLLTASRAIIAQNTAGSAVLSVFSTTGGNSYSVISHTGGDMLWYAGTTAGALTTPLHAYQQSQSGTFYWQHTPTAATWFQLRGSDKLVFNSLNAVGGLTAYVVISDERVKEATASVPYGLPEILKLNPIIFHRIDQPADSFELGFSAQEMRAVIPEAVREVGFGQPDDPGLEAADPTLGIMETSVIPVLVAAIHELTARLEILEAKGTA